ncbi:MAG: MauE/DoxX family redox-associated membrane protein [Rhodothermaceae bacterium]
MNKLNNKYLLLVIRVFIGGFFIFSSIDKINDPESFASAIENYRFFPVFVINLIAITLPWIELVTGLLLLLGVKVKENSFVINLLLVAFNFLIIIALIRGLDIDCGCYGSAYSQKAGLLKVFENFVLLFLGILLQIHSSNFMTILGKNADR